MKKLLAPLIPGLLLTSLFVGQAEAALITDPSQLSDSTVDINFDTTFFADYSNITISGFTPAYMDYSGFQAATTYPTYVSGNVFIMQSGGTTLTIDFATAVSEVGFGLADSNFAGTGFEAFDSLGNSLTGGFQQSPTGAAGGVFATYMGLTTGSNLISRVTITAASGDALGIDNISFNQTAATPIPGAVWLFGTGIAGLVGAAKRKKAKALEAVAA